MHYAITTLQCALTLYCVDVFCRTTPQWFVDLTDVQEKAVAAIGEGKPRSSESDSEKEEEPDLQQQEGRVRMIPAAGRNRLTTMLRGRAAWCISRQRVWGVPIPVFYEVCCETFNP